MTNIKAVVVNVIINKAVDDKQLGKEGGVVGTDEDGRGCLTRCFPRVPDTLATPSFHVGPT